MLKALHTAATGMAAQETNVSTISNNIANVNTTGFKKSRTEFDDLLYQTIKEAGARTTTETEHNVGVQVGSGAKVNSIRKSFSQGQPQITNNPFDLMIEGQGLFGVLLPNGELRFTRDGAFNVNAQGQLVTKNGLSVFPGITIPPNTKSVNVATDGAIDAYLSGTVEPQRLGVLPIFTFVNPTGLRSQGANLYAETTASGVAQQKTPGVDEAGFVQQGTLESSNVRIMDEMTNLIKAQRAYEMNSKVMGVADQILQVTNNIR